MVAEYCLNTTPPCLQLKSIRCNVVADEDTYIGLQLYILTFRNMLHNFLYNCCLHFAGSGDSQLSNQHHCRRLDILRTSPHVTDDEVNCCSFNFRKRLICSHGCSSDFRYFSMWRQHHVKKHHAEPYECLTDECRRLYWNSFHLRQTLHEVLQEDTSEDSSVDCSKNNTDPDFRMKSSAPPMPL